MSGPGAVPHEGATVAPGGVHSVSVCLGLSAEAWKGKHSDSRSGRIAAGTASCLFLNPVRGGTESWPVYLVHDWRPEWKSGPVFLRSDRGRWSLFAVWHGASDGSFGVRGYSVAPAGKGAGFATRQWSGDGEQLARFTTEAAAHREAYRIAAVSE